jgi:hypothetical protein
MRKRIAISFDKGRCPPYALLQQLRSMSEEGKLVASVHDLSIGVLHVATKDEDTHRKAMDIIRSYMREVGDKVLSACIYPIRFRRKGAA